MSSWEDNNTERLVQQFQNLEVSDDIWFSCFSRDDQNKRIKKLLFTDINKVTLPKMSSSSSEYLPEAPLLASHNGNVHTYSWWYNMWVTLSLPYSVLVGDNVQRRWRDAKRDVE